MYQRILNTRNPSGIDGGLSTHENQKTSASSVLCHNMCCIDRFTDKLSSRSHQGSSLACDHLRK